VRWLDLWRDMPVLTDAYEGFVLSSAWEGMPLAVGEATAMEKPVVATCVGGVAELMGNTGRPVAQGKPAELAEAMPAVMREEPKIRNANGPLARQSIAENFGFDAKVSEWKALYSRLCIRTEPCVLT
jgi:glycosyltransferase involved in cell wall biosynthesis